MKCNVIMQRLHYEPQSSPPHARAQQMVVLDVGHALVYAVAACCAGHAWFEAQARKGVGEAVRMRLGEPRVVNWAHEEELRNTLAVATSAANSVPRSHFVVRQASGT